MPRTQLPTDFPATGDRSRALPRLEAALLGLILLLGLGLRSLRPEAMAIEHFDEGVYAANLYCGHLDPPFAYPMRHLYAPPLFPAVLEWAQILAGPAAVMWVNVALGSLTVLAVWWTTRCWFGRSAAIAAALLAATSEYHIAFSRMALTDVPLSLLMLLGVFAGWKAILTGRPLWIAAAGLVAGLAWCTKYNGWLALAVSGLGTAAAFLVPKLLLGNALATKLLLGGKKTTIANCKMQIANCKFKLMGGLVRWGLTAAIAGLVFWGFVLRDLGPVGGYAAVAKNHAGYFVGLGGWWSGLLRQGGAHDLLMGWPSVVGIAAAWLACAWVANCSGDGRAVPSVLETPREPHLDPSPRPSPPNQALPVFSAFRGGEGERAWAVAHATIMVIAVVLMAFGALLTVSGLLSMAALAGFVGARRQRERDDTEAGSQLAVWMLLAWFVGLLVAVPLYFPYPRLSLPWIVACWPLAGAGFAWFADSLRTPAVAAAPAPRIGQPAPALPIGKPWLAETGLGSAPPPAAGAPFKRMLILTLMGVVVGVPLVALDSGLTARRSAWQSRQLLAGVAQMVLIEIEQSVARGGAADGHDLEAVVYVQGSPAMFFQLATLCRSRPIVIAPVAEAAGLKRTGGTPTFLVASRPAGEPEPSLPAESLIVSSEFVPSDLVLLDRMPAGELTRGSPTDVVSLYELRHGGY